MWRQLKLLPPPWPNKPPPERPFSATLYNQFQQLELVVQSGAKVPGVAGGSGWCPSAQGRDHWDITQWFAQVHERHIVTPMASKKSYLESLRKVSLFSSCSNKDLEKIAKAGDEVSFTAGSLVVDQGQTGREAFVIISGTATVKRNGKKVATLGTGAVVGELSLLDHGPRTASVITDTECVMLVISQRQFLGVIDAIPALSHKLLGTLAGRIRELDRQYFG